MTKVSAVDIRRFIIERHKIGMSAVGGEVPDKFDLLLEGVIDSFGMLELIGAIEESFGIEVDLEALDPDQLTQIGPLSRYMAGERGDSDVP